MPTTNNQPGQIPASDTGSNVKTVSVVGGTKQLTETIVLKKITPKGTDGSVVLVDGKQVSHVAPT